MEPAPHSGCSGRRQGRIWAGERRRRGVQPDRQGRVHLPARVPYLRRDAAEDRHLGAGRRRRCGTGTVRVPETSSVLVAAV